MAHESVSKTFIVAIALAATCSLLVAGAAIGLRPRQEANKVLDRKINILIVADLYDTKASVEESFKQIETRIVDLATGEYVAKDQLDPETFDQRAAARDPELSVKIPPEKDYAGIGRREKYSLVYLVKKNGKLDQVILPIDGKGLWSTLYGFLALSDDLKTIRGITFYEHSETPGLGGEVDNSKWQAQWVGKKIYGKEGSVQFHLVKGVADKSSPEAEYQVDGLSGATLTANGVTDLIKYWMGNDGFKKLLERLQAEGA
ncbi:Na+-transporting NADH:ubiquinone oxidoreductase, subunit NqrC [Candidatus Scalindua japonica]|uniref:Na(+)-translocating NADH-quinone reductase subunit C n=1 Tax=Candidatus Scalindua japonica TaxID=1284222 RepID=A0A286TXR7_9BACT|nr:Na(+)-translocating NADH-quinone reductase subunit C [Candidatus Scalindua japonica]GAX60667.1 Na+-transporting NADH:ubiquinone oxidoreductase, subunit NqrC [Candidatus Scalindua japonica]